MANFSDQIESSDYSDWSKKIMENHRFGDTYALADCPKDGLENRVIAVEELHENPSLPSNLVPSCS